MGTSDITNAIGKLRTIAGTMQSDPRFECEFEEFAFADAAEIQDIEDVLAEEMKIAGFRLPAELAKLYAATGGFRFQWLFHGPGARKLAGGAEIASPLEIYQREGQREPTSTRLEEWRIFDRVAADEAVELRPADAPLKLRFQKAGRPPEPLALDVSAYIGQLVQARALYRWQRRYSDHGYQDANFDKDLAAVIAATGG